MANRCVYLRFVFSITNVQSPAVEKSKALPLNWWITLWQNVFSVLFFNDTKRGIQVVSLFFSLSFCVIRFLFLFFLFQHSGVVCSLLTAVSFWVINIVQHCLSVKPRLVPEPHKLNAEAWHHFLEKYDPQLRDFLLKGVSTGFRAGVEPHLRNRLWLGLHALHSNARGKQFMLQDLHGGVEKGWILGPYNCRPPFVSYISPIGTVPKDVTELRMIRHMSFKPKKSGFLSLNECIPDKYAKVVYPYFSEVVALISHAGKNGYIFKIDLANAFRQLPIHPDDWQYFCYHLDGKYYIDTRWPFGVRSACPLQFGFVSNFFYQRGSMVI